MKKFVAVFNLISLMILFAGCASTVPRPNTFNQYYSNLMKEGSWVSAKISVQTPQMAYQGLKESISSIQEGIEPRFLIESNYDIRIIGREYEIMVKDKNSDEVIWSVNNLHDYLTSEQWVSNSGIINWKIIDNFYNNVMPMNGVLLTRWDNKKIAHLLKSMHTYIVIWSLYIDERKELLDSASFTVISKSK